MFTISAAKLVQTESNQACLNCRGAAEFRGVIQFTLQNYMVFSTNQNLKQYKSCLKRYKLFTFHFLFFSFFHFFFVPLHPICTR